MIQLSSLLPAIPHGPVRPAALDPAGASSFALAMTALAAPRVALPPPLDGDADPLLPARQPLAEGGKDLPEDLGEGDAETDSPADDPDLAEDTAFAWFAMPLPAETAPPTPAKPSMPVEGATAEPMAIATPPAVPVPAMATPLVPMPGDPEQPIAGAEPAVTAAALVPPALPEATAATALGIEGAPIDVASLETVPVPAATVGGAVQEAPRVRVAAPRATVPPAEDAPAAPHIEAPIREAPAPLPPSAPRPAQFQPATAPVAPPTVTPQLAAAIEAAALGAPAVSAPSRRAPAIEAAVIALAPSADSVRPHAVAAAADVEQSMIDMRRQEWMGQMVEQIEALRDAAPLRETRLSLAPEALGKVDISIRQEGEHVHVHFATETQAARQLIADAQPRLGELAEARGIKLGQTSFESGTAGQGGRDGREAFAQPQSTKPRPAPSESAVGTPDDDRIA
ncbi:flagellar hook-length control protein FliK [Sphingomonas sp. HF-S4]|uniref:Flagellar hook-length control protein FliK n=1 Tax=Sphingomonas agrestis TaxID=3080540 RepID=A0ABU3YAQ0_9SPHN|nr:flagellar hook-length control protein FliK [Sphingomonas sp. HF-S4]MDV3458478.1 flagellar hook-length control protein FliK [Sphingomonas sp. HF-S4]